jgi:hypothetical protein
MKPHQQSFSNQKLKMKHLSLPQLNCDPFDRLLPCKKKAAILKPICHRRIISEEVLTKPKNVVFKNLEVKAAQTPRSLQSPRLSPSSFLKLNPNFKNSRIKIPTKGLPDKIKNIDLLVRDSGIAKDSAILNLFKGNFKGNYLVRRTEVSDSSFSEFSFGN